MSERTGPVAKAAADWAQHALALGQAAVGDLVSRPALWPFLVAAAAAVALVVAGAVLGRRVRYRRGRFLSANEKAFLRALDEALGGRWRVFAQVRLADLVEVGREAGARRRRMALNRVFGKSIDFVICEAESLDPVAAIEVDDRTHLLPARRERDACVNAVFDDIGVPLIRVAAQRSYGAAELRDLLARSGLPVRSGPERPREARFGRR